MFVGVAVLLLVGAGVAERVALDTAVLVPMPVLGAAVRVFVGVAVLVFVGVAVRVLVGVGVAERVALGAAVLVPVPGAAVLVLVLV